MADLTKRGADMRGPEELQIFLKKQQISETDERLPLIKKTWNHVIVLAADYFKDLEGTSYEFEDAFKVED